MKYQVIVIGSGPGGYVAAVRCAQLGFKTACVERWPTFGGVCLNVGCIPSKCVLQSTEYLAWLQHDAKEHGIECQNPTLNFAQMMKRKEQVVEGLTSAVANLFKGNKIDPYQGVARFIDPHTIEIDNGKEKKSLEADYFILATGSESIALPFLPFDKKRVLSSTGALSLPSAPKKMAVIGAGAIGIELASVYQRLGSEVVIIEMLERITPNMDQTMGRALQRILTKQGLTFHLSSTVASAKVEGEQVTLQVKQAEGNLTVTADIVLVSVGRRPYTRGLGLENAGIAPDKKGFIPIDRRFRTAVPHILAIGDVIEGPMLAHKSSQEGIAAAEIIAGQNPKINYLALPNVIYSHPELAAVGFTEAEAKDAGFDLIVGTSFFRGNARARCAGDIEGQVKVIGDKASNRLLGMHILGAHASEMIAEGMIAMEKKATMADLANAMNAHPTLSEAIKDASVAALGHAIH